MFELIPAVDIKNGRCVQLVQGKPGTGGEFGRPVDAAGRWVEMGASRLHVIDLDGAFKGRQKNFSSIKKIIRGFEVPVQVGGGIRSFEAAERLFNVGVDRVFVGTAAFKNTELLKRLVELYGDSIYVSIDSSDGEVMVDGWTEGSGVDVIDACSEFEEIGVGGFLFTNIDKEGLLEGIDLKGFKKVIDSTNLPVIASGGISSIDDVLQLRDAGAAGAVVGSALYKGKLDFERTIDMLSG
ncbi:1-(5-phosphoribosyl)-5-[(5-phosphoribosylamino)methylideneamino]imidazole-4-carboxamide isomerase [Methanonatronarchaeum sp. AMET6-2]|uniref:1-(5-phosphoribosyl)-5-[(5- phosphoribosylamino)methylideneamino]imidazole-4- carboxamide isomerase n=1 Tax=Methanonatronarchaeum sp. AMET6-2 TaxID=2933293 RepID=UPI00121A060B|nr:1-(5-phosphoribosyl)-5-[(5-phosphoribosylamino)methylideneamino]imidazole-4-carboxamide isomerase [Methanonatronarchaeum sp. AMET6-2]RZN62898.1 MAG: 1-(5-phosphoribosyl)-5-[(5-phosphoribosylamino)methylideneamino] imidazole-4-carboxamide isomerase [Methanonatronarchaeia archaeon]UOY09828.1 1-(5-phosphoribosyl)-5-[(5-phosphoribosylamino)methylideneamino]imidazole-4-carboxamide isomerase [Methanonatronarchaeum sp. AMET6-2]